MRTPTRLLVLFALLVAAAPSYAQSPEDTHVELGLMWWTPEPQITVASGNLSSDVDFVKDLGIEQERFREFRVTVKAARKHKIRFAYIPVRYEQEGAVLNRTITFRGVTYDLNLPVNTAFNWDYYRFGYEYDFVAAPGGFVGTLVDVKYNKIDAQVTSPIGDESTEQNFPVLTFGATGRVYFSKYVSATGEFTAFRFKHNQFDGKLSDFDLYAQANLGASIAAQGGYRRVNMDYFVRDDHGTLKLDGWYFGAVVRF